MAVVHNIPMRLRAGYLSMHRQTTAHLARCGVTADQFVLMFLLSEEEGITQRQLVQRAFSDPNTVRAMLILLENRGLVARDRHPTDGRAWKVTLTRKGRQVLKRSMTETQPLRRRMDALFSSKEIAAMAEYLSRITHSMESPERTRIQSRPRRPRAAGRKPKHS